MAAEDPTVEVEPLPCPFACGSENVVFDFDCESIVCNDCGATGPSMLSLEFEKEEESMVAATKAWNARRPTT